MTKYYEAEICMMTELYIDNDRDKGCDPDSLRDCGVVETIKDSKLETLISKLKNSYENIEHFEDNRYETGYEEIERDGTYVSVMVSIYITEVIKETRDIDDSSLFNNDAA